MSKIQPNERDFQNKFKRDWRGFCSQFHPGQSSDPGIADVFVLSESGLIPVEIKVGTIDEDDVLWCSAIRPAQRGWHSRLSMAGGISVLAVGVWQVDRWRCFVVDALYLSQWETTGWKIGDQAIELDMRSLTPEFDDFIESIANV